MAILEVGHEWQFRGGAWSNSSKRKDTVSAKSHGVSASLRTPCASCCAGWDGRFPRLSRPSWLLLTKKVRTQTCPLFAPTNVLSSAWTPIQPIAVLTDYWRVWDCWRTRSALWCSHGHRTRWSSLGAARLGWQRCLRLCPRNLWQPWPGLLWVAHQPADSAAHGAVAHQTPGGFERIFAPRPGASARVGPRAGSQNAPAQTGSSGGYGPGRPVRHRPGSATGRVARSGPGIPLRRRPCADLPRPTPTSQGSRGPHAYLHARHFGLLGQRQGWRSIVRRHG